MTALDEIVSDYGNGACVHIKVITSSTSKDNPLTLDLDNHVLKVRTNKPREGGKANAAVLALLKDFFGAETRLVSGCTSARKKIYVALTKSEVSGKLSQCSRNDTVRQ